VLLSVLAVPLVRFVYGAKWAPAAATLVFLALLGAFRVVLELAYDYLMAVGHSRTLLWLQGLWLAALIPTLAAAAMLGGIRGVGAGHVAVAVFVVTPAVLLALHGVGIGLRELVRNLARPAVGAALAGITAATVEAVVPGDFRQLALGGILAGVVYIAVMLPMIRLFFRPRLAPS
jgi:PST family polysaccharide transporter